MKQGSSQPKRNISNRRGTETPGTFQRPSSNSVKTSNIIEKVNTESREKLIFKRKLSADGICEDRTSVVEQNEQVLERLPYDKEDEWNNQSGNIKVLCRYRPLNEREKEISMQSCVDVFDSKTVKVVSSNPYQGNDYPGTKLGPGQNLFTFDRVFHVDSSQEEVYHFAGKPVVESVLEGFNGTILAYGQTSSGKTFTMQGPSCTDERLKGIIPRMVDTVFSAIERSPENIEFTVKVAIVEIYNEVIRDLLDPARVNLRIREDRNRGVYIEEVSEHYVASREEVIDFIRQGNANRVISSTNMNEQSSRSHLIFTLTVSQKNLKDLSAKVGKLFLVDLAGSEKVAKTGAEGRSLEEAKKINQSLLELGNVINSLTEGKSTHIPYRNSKLTRILQESLGGNSRTTLIITCSPSPYNEAETISTMRFGTRAKNVKNKPKINREFSIEELKLLLEKAERANTVHEKRIKQLEAFIISIGSVPPPIDLKDFAEAVSNQLTPQTESHNSFEEDIASPEERKEDPFPIISDLTILQKELVDERENNKTQVERLNTLRKDLAILSSKTIALEDENESLLQKLTEKSFRLAALEEALAAKEKGMMTSSRSLRSPRFPEAIQQQEPMVPESLYEQLRKENEQLHKELKEKEEWEYEKAKQKWQAELQLRIEKIIELEAKLEEERARIRQFQGTLTQDEKQMTQKISSLEKNLDQLRQMYQQIATADKAQNSVPNNTKPNLYRQAFWNLGVTPISTNQDSMNNIGIDWKAKQDRIIALQKTHKEVAEKMAEYKSKLQQLQMYIGNELERGKGSLGQTDLVLDSIFKQEERSNGQGKEVRERNPISRIVKHIRGGGKTA